jgi:alkylation response protein AidB-like acyl-CoA dehydrogenase
MDFHFNNEQQQFGDALRRYLSREYIFEDRREIIKSTSGISELHWKNFTELGLLALPVPEAQGGFAGSPFDMLLVMQELGRALVVEPYWATAVCVEALRLAGDERFSVLLASTAAGESRIAFAFHESAAGYDLMRITTHAKAHSQGFVLSGQKVMVQHGGQAGHWLVPAMLNGHLALFMVSRDAAGAEVRDFSTVDGQRAATLVFDKVVGQQIEVADVAELIEQVADYGILLLCAEALGALDALNEATVEYAKDRQQFGIPIGRFQALQHRMVDMRIHTEQARSITLLAAARYTSGDPDERRQAICAAKVRVGQAARFVGQQAVQLHGAMGVSEEVMAGHWFKRLAVIDSMLGNVDHHLTRFAGLRSFSAETD